MLIALIVLPMMLWLCAQELRRRPSVSSSVWMVVLWVILVGSRPVSTWFAYSGETGGAAAAYDEGNFIDRWVHMFLILGGIVVLLRRTVSLKLFCSQNRWLVFFFLYWACSVVWSDEPLLSMKRWFKDIGNIIMVLLVLSETHPVEAIKAVFLRCSYVLLPMSVILIRFSGLGRAYHVWSGDMMFTGVATHKNSLGALVLVCGLFLIWDFFDQPKKRKARNDLILRGSRMILLLLAGWLLLKARSATAMACMIIGVSVIFGMQLPMIRSRFHNLGTYLILGSLLLVLFNAMFNLVELVVVHTLGRDMTLTTRTEVWPMLISHSSSWFFGCGFNAFWSGERLDLIYNKLGIIQAHNGYLETFLNGGMLGIVMLIAFLSASFKVIKEDLQNRSQLGKVRLAFFLICIMYNFTEASFNKNALLWFVQLLVCINYSRIVKPRPSKFSHIEAIPLFTLGAVQKD